MASGLIASLVVRINADVRNAERQIQAFNRTVQQTGGIGQQAARQQATATRALHQTGQAAAIAGTAVGRAHGPFSKMFRAFGVGGAATGRLSSQMQTLAGVMAPQHAAALQVASAYGGIGIKAGAAVGGIAAVGFALTKSAKAAVQWESDFAGVTKTVEGTPQQLAAISDELRRMATEIPTSTTELAGIAESAGQLGIATENVTSFTRTIADLNETTNLVGQEGATQLARLANITQMSQHDFDRLGSTVVALGNNLATTEAEISTFALRIAGAGAQVGLTEAEILAVGGALSSVGINAEAGGTAISRTMIEITRAAEMGGSELDEFAKVAGMSASEFAAHWKEDPAAALVTFVEGLGAVEAQGGSVFQTLEALGVTEQRMRDALLRSAGAGDLLRQSLQLGNDAWRENNALTDEAAKRYETTAARIEIAKNNFHDLGIEIGGTFLPAIGGAADGVTEFMQTSRGLTDRLAEMFDGFQQDAPEPSGWMAGIAPSRWSNMFKATMHVAKTAVVDYAEGGREAIDAHRKIEHSGAAAAARVADAGNVARGAKGAVDEYGDAAAEAAVDLDDLAASAQAALSGVQGFADPMRAYSTALSEHNAALRDAAAASAEKHNKAIDSQISKLRERTSARVSDYRAERSAMGDSETRTAAHFKKTTGETVRGMEAQTRTRIEELEAQKRATDDGFAEIEASYQVYRQSLEAQLQDQRDWFRNLNEIRRAAGDEYADYLMAQGPEQAGLVAEIAEQSNAEIRKASKLQQRIQDENLREQLRMLNRYGAVQVDDAGNIAADTVDALAEQLGVAPSKVEAIWDEMRRTQRKKLIDMTGLSANGAGNIVDAFGQTLDLGQEQVSKIIRQYGKALAAGLNPVLASIDGKPIVFRSEARARRVYQAVGRRGVGPGIARNAGGPIPGGGPDRDTVPALLTPGEHVWTRSEVQAVGGHEAMLRMRQAAKAGAIQMFKYGGIVQVGRTLQQQGYLVGEHPAFGGVAPVHTRNSYHYRGQALDINWPGSNEPAKLDQLKAWILANVERKLIRELIWRAPGHHSHLHLAMGGGRGTYMPGGGAAMMMPELAKVPDFPHGGIAGSAGQLARHTRAEAQKWLEANVLAAGGPVGTDLASVSGSLKQMAQQLLSSRGWADHWQAFNTLVAKESSWNPRAQNPTSTAYGLGQFLDSTWATVGGRKTSDPKLQLEYMMRYIDRRYGDPSKALAFHLRNNWYDAGGLLQPGTTVAHNNTGGPEIIAARGMIRAEAAAAINDALVRGRRETRLQDKLDKLTERLVEFEKAIADREAKAERKALTRELANLRKETRNERARLERELKKADSPAERKRIQGEQRRVEREYTADRRDIQRQQRDTREQRRVDQWRRQIEQLEDAIAAERDYVDMLREHTDAARSAVDDETSTLNAMLDEYDRVQQSMADARARYDEAAVEAQKRFNDRRVELEKDYQRQVSDLLEARRDELRGWMALDQFPDGSKVEDAAAAMKDLVAQLTGAGMSESSVDLMARRGGAGGLIDSVSAQTAVMREWREGLETLRSRGVSADVFAGFDLDSSPAMVETVRKLVAATDDELGRLNEVVAARNAEIDVRVAEEQRLRLGRLGQQLVEARQAYDQGIRDAQAQFHADMAAANEQLQADLQAAREQLAQIGQDTGRDWSQAIADGIASKLPAILEQVAKVRAALAQLQSAQSALDKAAPSPATSGVSGAPQWANVKSLFDKHGVSLSKGASPGESAGQRVDRIAREVVSGQRSLADVEKSIRRLKGLHAGGIVPARPGGFLARIGEGNTDEAVIPLPKGWQQAVSDVAAGKTSRSVTINIDARGAQAGVGDEIKAAVKAALAEEDRVYAREWESAGIGV